MRALTATEAITPAMDHISRLLNPRYNWRLLVKVAAVAFFAQLGGFNLAAPPGIPSHGSSSSSASSAMLFPILFGVSLLFFVVILAFFYLGSRLQFVLFDLILNRQTIIGPSWRRFGRVTWRWIGLKTLLFFGMIVCLLPIFLPLFIHFFHVVSASGGGQISSEQVGSFFAAIFSFFGVIFLLVLIAGSVYCLLADFGLPFIALENTSISETVRRVWLLVRAEPGQFLFYLLLRFVFLMAAAIGCELATIAFAVLLAIPLGGVSFALWLGLRHASPAGHIFLIAGWVVAGLVFLVLILLAAIVCFGYVLSFFQAYSIYFLAGRYPLLGETLDPTPGRPYTPPPPFAGPDEPGDGSGPGFPMDPVPA